MRCNTVSGDVTILLPTGLSAFPERVVKTTISKFQSANSVIIDAGTGKVIRGAQTLKLSSAESCLELTHGQAASTRWDITGSQSTTTNTLTLSAAVTTTKADTSILTGSKIMLTPTNVAAANLMLGTKSLYVSAKTAGTSFAVTTADGTAAAGTETFDYVIVN
jgi:uridylate kinase